MLTDSGSGQVLVAISLGTGLDLKDASVFFFIDSDRNASTGNSMGAEYTVVGTEDGTAFARRDGTQPASFDHEPLAPSLSGGTLAFTLTLADVGNVASFDSVVGSAHGDDVDTLPEDKAATWPARPQIKWILVPASVILGPKAGKVFRLDHS